MENISALLSDDEPSFISINSDDSCILLSPALNQSQVDMHKDNRDEKMLTPSRYPLLESVSARFAQNRNEMNQRISAKKIRRDVELAHSQYLRNTVASPEHMSEARTAVQFWANKHNTLERSNRQILRAKRRHQSQEADKSIEILSPSISSSPLNNRNVMTLGRSRHDDSVPILPDSTSVSSSATGREFYNCKVLNCDVEFSSLLTYNQHQNQILHTPCNPLRHLVDNKVPAVCDVFMCPECSQCIKGEERCKKHMQDRGHLEFLDPLPVGGYMCGQCLMIFPDSSSCWSHILAYCHGDRIYPFQDDVSSDNSEMKPPVPVPVELCNDFQSRCRQVPSTVSCVDCNTTITNDSELGKHHLKSRGSHVLSSSATGTVVEVFSQYITGYNCAMCTSVCALPENEQDEHQCGAGMSGAVIENSCKTFQDFVKCCGISFSVKRRTSKIQDSKATPVLLTEATNFVNKTSVQNQISENNNGLVNNTKRPSGESSIRSGSPRKKTKCSNTTENSAEVYGGLDGAISGGTDDDEWKRRISLSPQSSCKNEKCEIKQGQSATASFNNAMKSIFPCDCSKKRSHQDEPRDRILDQCVLTSLPSVTSQGFSDSSAADSSSIQSSSAINFTSSNCQKTDSNTSNFVEVDASPSRDAVSVDSNSAYTNLIINCTKSKPSSSKSPDNLKRQPINVDFLDLDDDYTDPVSTNRRIVYFSGNQRKNNSALETGKNRKLPNNSVPQSSTMENVVDLDNYNTMVVSSGAAANSLFLNTEPKPTSPVDLENLKKMKQILFLDIDNWPKLFQKLPTPLPERTFVWGFYGGKTHWIEPRLCAAFSYQKDNGWFHLHDKCGTSKDAADFAICLMVGRMDERLPKHIPFTILSGDKGFHELERQMSISNRRAVVIDPHAASAFSGTMIYTMVTSVTDM